jgi:hypothetical protein
MQRRLQLAQPWLRSRNAGFHGSDLDTPCAAPKAVASSSSRCLVPLARRFRSQRRRPSTSALRKFTHSSGDVCTMTSAAASPRGRVQRAPSSRRRRRLHRDDARGACRQRPRPHASRALVERGLRKAGCPLVGSGAQAMKRARSRVMTQAVAVALAMSVPWESSSSASRNAMSSSR